MARSDALSPEAAAVKAKIDKYIEEQYTGSGDIEASDVVDFYTFFEKKYPGREGQEQLLGLLQRLESRVQGLLGWNPGPPQDVVLEPQPDKTPDFYVAPWQLGLSSNHSVKGKSKFIHILDTVHNFLNKPYNSIREPLDLLFEPSAQPGSPVAPWSMHHSVGAGKSSAARIILEAVCSLTLSDAEVAAIGLQIKALLRMRAIYDPAPTDEEQLLRAMAAKAQQAERPRPDPLMWWGRWSRVLAVQGLIFNEVIAMKIKEYNRDKSDGVGITADEAAVITYLPFQSPEFTQLLEYHWQNYKVRQSAVTTKRLNMFDLSPQLKPKRCAKDNVLWNKILTWTPQQNVLWLQREIGTFLKNVKEQVRANKKVNLAGNSRYYRGDATASSHDEVCVFAWFLKDFQQHCTPAQFIDLTTRFQRGHLNKDTQR